MSCATVIVLIEGYPHCQGCLSYLLLYMYMYAITCTCSTISVHRAVTMQSCHSDPNRSVIKKIGHKVTAKSKAAKAPEVIKEECDDQPRELPFELWTNCLQSLYLQSNQLKWLPDYVGKFSALTRLDISG